MDEINKKSLVEELYKTVENELDKLKKIQKGAQERANEAEGAMQSRYDTFKEEGQYLADGLKIKCFEAESVLVELKEFMYSMNLVTSDRVRMFSLVRVEYVDGESKFLFIFPALGGDTVRDNITLVTPSSPIGKVLIGKKIGDEFTLTIQGRKKEGEIIDVL